MQPFEIEIALPFSPEQIAMSLPVLEEGQTFSAKVSGLVTLQKQMMQTTRPGISAGESLIVTSEVEASILEIEMIIISPLKTDVKKYLSESEIFVARSLILRWLWRQKKDNDMAELISKISNDTTSYFGARPMTSFGIGP